MNDIELKPCPFCKAIPKKEKSHWGYFYYDVRHESNCFIYGLIIPDEEESIEQWNTRPDPPKVETVEEWISVDDTLPNTNPEKRVPHLCKGPGRYNFFVTEWREYSNGPAFDPSFGKVLWWKPIIFTKPEE